MGGRAEADGIGEALLERDTVVGHARRQVKHVPGTEHPFVFRAEAAQNAQVEAAHVVLGEALGHAPHPAPATLKEEDVIAVHVRSPRASGRGQADHHVVDPPAGEEVEAFDQIGHGRNVRVHVLDEHRPVRRSECARQRTRKRAVGDLPFPSAAALAHEP